MGLDAADPEGGMGNGTGLATEGIMGPATLRDHKHLHRRGCSDRDPRRFTEHAQQREPDVRTIFRSLGDAAE